MKAASEGGRQEDRKRKDGKKRREGQSGKKGKDEAARPIHTNYKHPLQRHYDKYNIIYTI